MKQYKHLIPCSIHPSLLPGSQNEVLFFDIETTGFSPERENVYLIGCVYYTKNGWELTQFFLDEEENEADFIHSFFTFAAEYQYLIHFNGDSFDIPFLEKRAKKLGLSLSFTCCSIDLYKEIRPFKTLLALQELKQKNLEIFLGFKREDTYDGSRLIEVYYDYQNSKDQKLLSLLLLHNADDLKGMLTILNLRSLLLLKEGHYSIQKTICQNFTVPSGERQIFASRLLLNAPLPISIYYDNKAYSITTQSDKSLLIKVPVLKGTLNYYYPNYKDYYYLPEEDYAIHKSIASYVDSAHRIKAKASTCYTKKEGCFLIQPIQLYTPEFKQNYSDKYSYFEITEDFLHSEKKIKNYLTSLLSQLGTAEK